VTGDAGGSRHRARGGPRRRGPGGAIALATAVGGALGIVWWTGSHAFALPRPQGTDLWTNFGHGHGGDFNNQADTAITPANVRHLEDRWTVEVPPCSPCLPTPWGASTVSGNPIVSAHTLYFGTWEGTVEAVNRFSGKVRWVTSVAGSDHAMVNNAPALYEGKLYVATTTGRIWALDPHTGRVLWKSPEPVFPRGVPDAIESSVMPYHGVLYMGLSAMTDTNGELGGEVAVSARDGRLLWRRWLYPRGGWDAGSYGTPVLWPQRGLLFLATSNPLWPGKRPPGRDLYSETIVALHMDSGRVQWYYQPSDKHFGDFDFLAGPTFWYGPWHTAMVGDGKKNGWFYAVNAATGRLVWATNLTPVGSQTLIMAPAAAGYGLLFVPTFDIPLAVLYNQGFPFDYQPPATGRLVALSARTGRVVWSFAMPSAVPDAAVVGDGMVFTASSNGEVYALDVRTGQPLWWNNYHGQIWRAEAGLTLVGNQLFVPVSAPEGGVTMFSIVSPRTTPAR
jgi:polyvinyl alcohol dehydrogenase (cytochrome)